jgi:16S rRNA (cytosine967-C5)-methyltransferase
MRRSRPPSSFPRGEKTEARRAQGRERVLVEQDPLPVAYAAALDVLARRRAASEPLDRVVAAVARERHLGPRERRATADLAFGWARHAGAVDALVERAVRAERGVVPRRRQLDLAAVCLAAIAAGLDVDERARLTLPGALRTLVDDAVDGGLSLPVALPDWLVARLTASLGDDANGLLAALGQPAPTVLAVDRRRARREDVVEALREHRVTAVASAVAETALRVTAGRLSVTTLPASLRSAVWPMDDGSQAVAHAVGARAGERVLDLCAGGGGKARLLLAAGAEVVAADIDAGRLARSLPAGAAGVVADGTKPPWPAASFDRVLVDAPCSGTGTLRRAPDLALRLDPGDLPGLIATQKALLSSALDLVRPGGRVVYATCSLLSEENDAVVTAVVGSRTDVVRHDAPAPFSTQGMLTPPLADGFFVALLERRT